MHRQPNTLTVDSALARHHGADVEIGACPACGRATLEPGAHRCKPARPAPSTDPLERIARTVGYELADFELEHPLERVAIRATSLA